MGAAGVSMGNEEEWGSQMGSLVRRYAFVMAGIAVVACLWLGSPLPARAAPLTVTNCNDSGGGSLRDAITTAASGDSIGFTPGLNCTSGGLGPITLSSTLTIGTELTIDGTGATIAVDGLNAVTDFFVPGGVTATLNALTIQHGNNPSDIGGGILDEGALTVTNSTFANNSASNGAGIGNSGGTLTVTNSTFVNNSASNVGGGIFTTVPTNSHTTVTNSTFSSNSALRGGGVFYNATTTTTLTNTIVAGNSGRDCATDGMIAGTLNAGADSLADDGTCGGATVATGAAINLRTLASNGGPTQTIALGAGSVAIGAGDATVCANTSGTAPVAGKDQRSLPRPAAVCAIGAYEPQPNTIIATAGGGQQATVGTAFPTALAAKVADDQANPLPGWSVTFAAPPSTGPSGTFAGSAASATATTNASGVATAPSFAANTVAGANTVTANVSPALVPPASFALTNLPGAPATLAVTGYPSPAVESIPNPFVVTALDQYGNTATGYTGTVHFTSTDPRAALPADYPFVAGDAGTHTFSAAFGTAGSQNLTATDTTTAAIAGTQAAIAVSTVATTTTLAVAPSPAVHGASVALTATVAAVAPTSASTVPAAPVMPGGIVTFADGSTTLATVTLVGGTAALATNTLTVGVHHLTATYNPSVPGPYATSAGAADETITTAPLVAIAVTPGNGTLKVGQAQQFVATGTYADSSTADLTSAVTWSSDAPGVIGVDATGEGTGEGAGSAHVVATQGGVSGQASVTVGTPVLTGVQPAPAPQGRPSGATSQPGGGPTAPSPPPAPAPTGR
jgi:hypothetical protein